MFEQLSIENIFRTRESLGDRIITTPAHKWEGIEICEALGDNIEVYVKLELFQQTGSFKARGALNVMMQMEPDALRRGVTTASSGNHAIAIAYSAKLLGSTAKVVMAKNANALRVKKAQKYGAEIVFADSGKHAFELANEIALKEGRQFVHPYEGHLILQGTGTAGLEFTEQVPELDAMILPIGGGGLCAGFASALKQVWPNIQIFGVEPIGANVMYRSFENNRPETLDTTDTIADSLAPPKAEPFTYAACRKFVDEIVLVSDEELRTAMSLIFHGLKLAVEPSAAASTAGLCGPLKDRLQGKRVGIIACGANIDSINFCQLINDR